MEHYPRNTVEVGAWCSKCHKETRHRVDGVKLGPCFDCMKRLDNPVIPSIVEPEIEQMEMF